MPVRTRSLAPLLSAAILISLLAPAVRADDHSFSSVVKEIETKYKGKRQGFFGAVSFARFLVKLIKPAGVKNFKVVMLKELKYADQLNPADREFHSFVRSRVHPSWQPLIQYASRREKQWTYVYATNEDHDVKILVVTLQQREAFVVQFKFSPERLVAFMNDPSIMGIRLADHDNRNKTSQDSAPPKEGPKAKKGDTN